jgi:renalase
MTSPSVLVVGAGISGLACARALREADTDIAVTVVDRSRVAGGRMASRRLHDRPVDLGASYFTAEPGTPFEATVHDWLDRGLARPWTDTFSVLAPEGTSSTTGPMRYSAALGLRSLVADLGEPFDIRLQHAVGSVAADGTVDGTRYDAVVLAMPDPQARRLLPDGSAVQAALGVADEWQPTIAVALGWDSRPWPQGLHGVFVHGSPVISFIADDGDRRGDGAPVLVVHTTQEVARQHLADPDGAIAPVVAEVASMLRISAPPAWTHAHRWTFARPNTPHSEPFLLVGAVGVCGDAWGGKSSVGAAWSSGDALGQAIAASL